MRELKLICSLDVPIRFLITDVYRSENWSVRWQPRTWSWSTFNPVAGWLSLTIFEIAVVRYYDFNLKNYISKDHPKIIIFFKSWC